MGIVPAIFPKAVSRLFDSITIQFREVKGHLGPGLNRVRMPWLQTYIFSSTLYASWLSGWIVKPWILVLVYHVNIVLFGNYVLRRSDIAKRNAKVADYIYF